MSADETIVDVYADWVGLGGPLRMGTLVVRRIRGTEVSSFEYDEAWLQRNDNRVLDPDLRLFGGPQYNSAGRPTFGVFVDSAPDRWGRSLMRRRETIRVRKDGGPPVDIASRHRVRRPPL